MSGVVLDYVTAGELVPMLIVLIIIALCTPLTLVFALFISIVAIVLYAVNLEKPRLWEYISIAASV